MDQSSPQTQYVMSPSPIQPKSPSSALAITSLVLGILAFLTGWFFLGIIFGIGAIITGILGLKRKSNQALAITGIVLGAIGGLSGIIFSVLVGSVLFSDINTKNSTKYNVEELATYKTSAISLSYPKSWKEDNNAGPVIFWTDGTTTKKGKTYINSRLVYEFNISELSVSTLSREDRQARVEQISKDKNALLEVFSSYADCESGKINNTADFDQGGLLGTRIDFSCKLKADASNVKGVGIVANDQNGINHLYSLFTTDDDIWENNEAVFNKMIADFKTIDSSSTPAEKCTGTKTADGLCITGGQRN